MSPDIYASPERMCIYYSFLLHPNGHFKTSAIFFFKTSAILTVWQWKHKFLFQILLNNEELVTNILCGGKTFSLTQDHHTKRKKN